MVKNKEKQFDCIKMKSSIQAQVYAETKNMSKKELLSYFNKNTQGHPLPVNLAVRRRRGAPDADIIEI